MSAATAKAKEVKPEGKLTIQEALALFPASAWLAVEEFGISLDPPRYASGRWLAGCSGEYVFGDSPVAAVGNLLKEIGGVKQ